MARNGSLPESMHFLVIFVHVVTADSALQNLANARQAYCGPLSDTMVPGMLWRTQCALSLLMTV